MNENLENIIVDEKIIDINSTSIEEMKKILMKVNDEENAIRQELDTMLKKIN